MIRVESSDPARRGRVPRILAGLAVHRALQSRHHAAKSFAPGAAVSGLLRRQNFPQPWQDGGSFLRRQHEAITPSLQGFADNGFDSFLRKLTIQEIFIVENVKKLRKSVLAL